MRALGESPTPPAFREWLLARGYSENSARNYANVVRKFNQRLHPKHLLSATLDDLHRAERVMKRVSPSTHNGHVQALTLYYRFAGRTERGNLGRAMSRHTTSAGLPRPLTEPDRHAYTAAAERLSLRHQVVAGLGIYAGLRIHEAAKVRWTDLYGGELRVVGKGRKERRVAVPEQLQRVLDKWSRECQDDEWLLPPLPGYEYRTTTGHIHPETVRRLHHEICDEADLPRCGYHRLRHTAGTEWYRASGGDILATGQFLGHTSPNSTRVYALVNSDRQRDIAGRMYK